MAANKMVATLFKLVLGLVFLALGALAVYKWWPELLLVIRGCIGPLMLLAGLVILAIAKE